MSVSLPRLFMSTNSLKIGLVPLLNFRESLENALQRLRIRYQNNLTEMIVVKLFKPNDFVEKKSFIKIMINKLKAACCLLSRSFSRSISKRAPRSQRDSCCCRQQAPRL